MVPKKEPDKTPGYQDVFPDEGGSVKQTGYGTNTVTWCTSSLAQISKSAGRRRNKLQPGQLHGDRG